ncbi:Enhanced filamentous growth protein 1 [Spathaspora sp. JA1]|nr:Enhanced filamentous growth protein 1 [Spathaspora sp. JA1]
MSTYSVSASSQDQMNGSFNGTNPQQPQTAATAASATSAAASAQPLSTQQPPQQQQTYPGQQPNYASYYMYNQQTPQQGIPEQQQQQPQGGDYNNARYQYMASAPGTATTSGNYYQQSNQAYSNRGYPGSGAQPASQSTSSNQELLAGGSNSSVGQFQPPGIRPRVTTTMWEDEKTLCYQVDANNVSVVRRADNNMINGTKLLNVAQMTRGRRDGILKSEKVRHVVKIGSMHLKGVWIPFERALSMAQREGIVDLLYPLFVRDIKRVIQTGVTPAAATATAATQQTSPPLNNKVGAGSQPNYYTQYGQQQQQYGQQYPAGTPGQAQANIVAPGQSASANQQSPQQQNPAVNDPQYQQVYGGYQQQYYNGAIATPNNPNNQYYQAYYNGSAYGQQQAYPYGYQQAQQGIPQQQQQSTRHQPQPQQPIQQQTQHTPQISESQQHIQPSLQPSEENSVKSPPTSETKKEKK